MNIFREFFGNPLKQSQARPSSGDEELSREFVRLVFTSGRETCQSIADGIREITRSGFSFPVNDEASIEISIAILGISLAAMKGHVQIMNATRGTQIEVFCRRSIQMDYNLSPESAVQFVNAVDEYQAAFRNSVASKKNPFEEPSGMLLVRWLGPQIETLFVPGTSELNPATHQLIGGALTLTVNEVLTFWK